MALVGKCKFLRIFSGGLQNVIRCSSLNFVNRFEQNEDKKAESEPHIYRKALTKNEIIDFLVKNIYFNEKNIIATHKPYGVGKEKHVRTTPKYMPQTLTECFLSEILADLSKKLGVDSLDIVQVPERYASGVTILATAEEAKNLMVKRIHNLKQGGIYKDTYLTVVVGKLKNNLKTTFSIKIEEKENKKRYPVILSQWPKQFQNRSNIRVYFWNHTVLSSTELASLVKVELSSSRLNSLRLFLATKCLTPVLGDPIFGPRVVRVNNVPLLVEPTFQQKQLNYDPELLSALKLHENDVSLIPSHVHLLTKVLPLSKRKKILVSIPPPDSFMWTCSQLGLKLDTCFLQPKNHLLIENGMD